jgi:hypothetical protein
MPSLTVKEVKDFSKWNTETFIETGTHMGDTTANMINEFEKLYSIELSENYASKAMVRFSSDNKVKIIQGDSVDVLNNLSTEVRGNIFFWLDGHWSGGDTARGSLDCPLLEEIKIINEKYEGNCIIAIDDVRLFGTNINENWLNVTRDSVLEIVKNRLVYCDYFPSYLDSEDRMVLHLKRL